MQTKNTLWTYDPVLDTGSSWTGYSVHAVDGDIGKIDEMSTQTGRGCLVVDTGFWIFGKKRMIPASAVRSVDHSTETVNVSLTKAQIKDAPDFDDTVDTSDERYYETTSGYYGPLI